MTRMFIFSCNIQGYLGLSPKPPKLVCNSYVFKVFLRAELSGNK